MILGCSCPRTPSSSHDPPFVLPYSWSVVCFIFASLPRCRPVVLSDVRPVLSNVISSGNRALPPTVISAPKRRNDPIAAAIPSSIACHHSPQSPPVPVPPHSFPRGLSSRRPSPRLRKPIALMDPDRIFLRSLGLGNHYYT